MKRNKLCIYAALTAAMLVSSCTTPKNITYMQGFENGQLQDVCAPRRLTVQPDDRLSIVVSSKSPELAQVFNLAIAQQRVGSSGSGSNTQQSASFTVTPDGCINYPVLGMIHIAGLERSEVAKLIETKLISENLLKDPVVTVEFMNATVSVLGDVSSPGDYTIDKDDMTLLQLLGKAGDLNITGERTNVLVVREEDGKNRAYRVDLTDTEALMQSPAYYLQQNDVVFVEPNDTKKRQATANGNTILTPSFWMSVVSLLTTITVLITK